MRGRELSSQVFTAEAELLVKNEIALHIRPCGYSFPWKVLVAKTPTSPCDLRGEVTKREIERRGKSNRYRKELAQVVKKMNELV